MNSATNDESENIVTCNCTYQDNTVCHVSSQRSGSSRSASTRVSQPSLPPANVSFSLTYIFHKRNAMLGFHTDCSQYSSH
ncbi:hypothetical protein CKAN_02565200 [Cinnamomum micranthum f. kanehirae]|uniref:Uncharacterized protein n=1 Tax=Cinnamomum micranthum f. kanehirae TaxID=337451 RepID=A0A3S3NXA1_9MAGN|nr:hypothetical protein CKAN_02565200 [Cinnamomum micranthum f. kanehirae]